MTRLLRSSNFWLLGCALIVVLGFSIAGVSQAQTTQKRAALAPEEDPVFHEYRGVKIGWVADEVRKKLGSPANKGDEQDFYVFGEKETCQVLYDKGQVTAISVHKIHGDGRHLALVVKDLASLLFTKDVEILLVTLVGRTAEFLADLIRNPTDLHSTIFVKDRVFLRRQSRPFLRSLSL